MKCLNCNKNKARKVAPYGYLPCLQCIKKQAKATVRETIELTTEDIKEDRKKFSEDIIQRYRGNVPSLEYIKKYGTKGFNKEELRQAKNVWRENNYYSDDHERYEDIV